MKTLTLTFLALMALQFSDAQGITASPDTTICAGQSVQLNVSGGTTYTWTPSGSLSSATSATPVATPAMTTQYVVSSPVAIPNIVFNGDFSLGDTGFVSSYAYQLPPNNVGQERFWVGPTPMSFSPGMSNCADHTGGGNGNMLIANGSESLNTPVWCETLSVIPNTTYNLSGWISTLNQTNLPQAQWMVNGTPVGGITNTFFTCFWRNFTATWNSGANTIATFCVFDPDTFANGNDYAMDDFSITATATFYDTALVTVLTPPNVNLGSDTSACNGMTVPFDAGNPGANYLWNTGATTQSISANSSGLYSVTVTDLQGCTGTDVVNLSEYSIALNTASVNTSCGNSNGSASVIASNGTSPYNYLWSNSGTTDTISNLAAGTYIVTVNDMNGCTVTDSAAVNSSGAGSVSITADNTQICSSDSSHICAPAGFVNYLWNNGATTQCIYTNLAGNYYITVTDNLSCTSTSNPVGISVYSQTPVSVSVNGDTLTAYNAVTYQWYLNGSPIGGATSDFYIATQQGNYTVLVTDTNGCAALSNNIVISGISDLNLQNYFSVFPNPNSSGVWNLKVSNGFVGKSIEVTDVEGRIIYGGQIRNTLTEIKFHAESGVYLLHIISSEKTLVSKLVKF